MPHTPISLLNHSLGPKQNLFPLNWSNKEKTTFSCNSENSPSYIRKESYLCLSEKIAILVKNWIAKYDLKVAQLRLGGMAYLSLTKLTSDNVYSIGRKCQLI